MNDKKLTKVQKEILTTLRDVPRAKIISVWQPWNIEKQSYTMD